LLKRNAEVLFYASLLTALSPLVAQVPSPPIGAISITPDSVPGTGPAFTQVFTITFADPGLWPASAVADVLINNNLDGQAACYFAIVPPPPPPSPPPSVKTLGYVYLADDAGDGGYAGGSPLTVTSANFGGSLSNSQCTIAPVAPATGVNPISIQANWMSFTVSVTFTPGFGGNKLVWAAARDGSNNSGWQAIGSWTVPWTQPPGPAHRVEGVG